MPHFVPASRAALRLIVVLLSSAGAMPSAFALDTFVMDARVFGAGLSQANASACFEVASTIGQPLVGGPFSTGVYDEYAGFWRAFPPEVDSIFSGRFEGCGP